MIPYSQSLFTPTPQITYPLPNSPMAGLQYPLLQTISPSIQPTEHDDSNSSPFVKELNDYTIPHTARLPTLKTYNGTTCPDSHIDTYEWHMKSLKLDKKFWCTYFATTLDGNAGAWLKSLAPNSISSFEQLKQLFLSNFMQLRRYRGDVNYPGVPADGGRDGESIFQAF